MIQELEDELLDYAKSLKSTLFENKIKVIESYDDQLTDENIKAKAITTPALLFLYRGDASETANVPGMDYTIWQWLVIAVSNNIATKDSKKKETIWIVEKVKQAFRGAIIKLNANSRVYEVHITGTQVLTRSKNLNVFAIGLQVSGFEGDDSDNP